MFYKVTNVDEEEFIENTPQINLVDDSTKDDQSNFNKRKRPNRKTKTSRKKKTSSKETSSYWDTFDKVMIEEDDGVKRRYGKCHWFERLLKADMERNETSSLFKHDGLKYQNYHVECIQKAVRYIRLSLQRINKFKKTMKDCGLQTKKFLFGDTPTRWNSTFELLKSAYQLREAFMEFGVRDYNFVDFGIIFSELQSFKVELSKLKYFSILAIILDYNSEFYVSLTDKSYERDLSRVPENYDFEVVTEMVKFFEKFKTKTKLVLATSKPLVNLFIPEVLDVDIHLRKWSTKPIFLEMVKYMKTKYNKYWGAYNKMKDFMYFAVHGSDGTAIDPRIHRHKIMSNGPRGSNLDPTDNEFRTYLKENIVNYKKDFSILGWWRVNVIRFLIVARMAKDILAIQISSVASEFLFSTCGRVVSE
uniref:HAT C-terminal dimerisation domain-containing protein n=1 Tax=Lactuca sativa TaxID=4236 RepID=A0A9R1WRI1_LACSA|nr:hypothetical protein LSAT_V11C100025950 [Lactuca sativa]